MQEVDLRRIYKLDPAVGEALNQAYLRALSDCEDRPGNKEPRKVCLEVSLVPRVDEQSNFDEVEMGFKVVDKSPVRKSKTHKLRFRKRKVGGRSVPVLMHNEVSEDNMTSELPFNNEE